MTLWGMHAGSEGSADQIFREKGFLALGWSALGDLSALEAKREAFKTALAETYPDKPAGAIPVEAGVLFRFLHEVRAGDIVAYPSREDRQIHYLRVMDSPYEYRTDISIEFPHLRAAELLKSIPRNEFSIGALNEIGAAISLFKIKNNAEEFLAKLTGEPVEVKPAEEELEAKASVPDPEESTQDFVLKRLSLNLKGHPFAHFVAHLLNLMGYRTQTAPPGKDGGIDILAHSDPLGVQGPFLKVQVKSTEGQTGEKDVRDLVGLLNEGERGLFVTLGTFNLDARKMARGPKGIRLVDGPEVVGLICEHYERLDHKYRSMLPLRHVWVPDPPVSTGE